MKEPHADRERDAMGHTGDDVGSAAGRAMDEQDALAEARRRWGERAEVGLDTTTCFDFCLVGVRGPGEPEPEWMGIGRTWELAFAEADLRAARR